MCLCVCECVQKIQIKKIDRLSQRNTNIKRKCKKYNKGSNKAKAMASAERGGAGNAGSDGSGDGGNKSRCNAYTEK